METTAEYDQAIVEQIIELINPKYLENAKLSLQVNKSKENSIIICIDNNPWRNGVSKGDMLFGRIKTNGKLNYFQFKNTYTTDLDNLGISYTSNNSEKKAQMIRVPFNEFLTALNTPSDRLIKMLNKIFVNNISFSEFGCCSKWEECEKFGKCLHTDQLYATACQYQKLLKRTGKFENT